MLAARDFDAAEGSEIGGILGVFPNFRTARMGQKIRRPAADDLFRVSLTLPDEIITGRMAKCNLE